MVWKGWCMVDDEEFDELMREAGAVPHVRSVTMTRLVRQSHARSLKVQWRRRVVLAVAIGGTLLLIAIASHVGATACSPF